MNTEHINRIADLWRNMHTEAKKLDPVDDKANDKKFKDRKDKDIDNDGDVDGSDKFLHKKRKAIDNEIDGGEKPAKNESTDLDEAKEHTYTVVHAKKGKVVVKAPTSYDAAMKAAKGWKLKSTAGIDSHLMEETLDEAQGKLNAKGEIEMTAKNYAKVHKDFKTKIKGTSYAMQIDPKTGGSALFPVTFIKESVEEACGDDKKMMKKEDDADAKMTACSDCDGSTDNHDEECPTSGSKKKPKKGEDDDKDLEEAAEASNWNVQIPKQTISGKTVGGGKQGIVVKAKTARQAISMATRRLAVDFKMLRVGKVIKEGKVNMKENAVTHAKHGYGEILQRTAEGVDVMFEHGVEMGMDESELIGILEKSATGSQKQAKNVPGAGGEKHGETASAGEKAFAKGLGKDGESVGTEEEDGVNDVNKASRVKGQAPTRGSEPRIGDKAIVKPVTDPSKGK